MEAVIAYLDEQDPEAAARARARYECLQPYGGESAGLRRRPCCSASASRAGGACSSSSSSCGAAPATTCAGTGSPPRTSTSSPSRTPRVVANAEEYYRTMFGDRDGSWNLRDRHMADTLDQLLGPPRPRTAARPGSWSGRTTRTSATRARPRWPQRGELNIGQLDARAPRPRCRSTSASPPTPAPSPPPRTGATPAERKRVRPALAEQLRGALSRRPASRPSCSARLPPATAAARCSSRASSARSA